MPNIRHRFVSTEPDGTDTSVVRPSDWNAPLQLTDVSGAPSGDIASIRKALTADTTIYVRTGGSDFATHTGTSDIDSDAFATGNYAMRRIAADYDLATNTVTIQYQAGMSLTNQQLFEDSWVGWGGIIVNFNHNTISTTNETAIQIGFTTSCGNFQIKNVTLTTTTSGDGISIFGSNIINIKGGMVFGSLGSSGDAHINAQDSSIVYVDNSYSITGGGGYHILTLAPPGCPSIYYRPATVTITGSPDFGNGFAVAQGGNIISPRSTTFTGTATGQRYSALLNGVIDTRGGGANYFPGDVAGTTTSGGQYA